VALAAAGLENVSFGHQHLSDGHALHHHHFYFGSHEHSGKDSDHHHDHEKAPHHHGIPQRSATVAGAPALAQPVEVSVLVVPWTEHTPAAPALAPAPPLRPAARLIPPRAPPTLSPS
jgi:hypothetical protein